MQKLILTLIIGVFGLIGCAPLTNWTPLKPNAYTNDSQEFKASLPEGWMRYNLVKSFLMTKDGIVLDSIVVARQKFNTKLQYTKKDFLKDMSVSDLAEVEKDDVSANPAIGKFEVISEEPTRVSNQEAFRMEYVYTLSSTGLKIHGIHYGFIYNDFVYRIRYEAADQHYFAENLAVFETFIQSFELTGAKTEAKNF